MSARSRLFVALLCVLASPVYLFVGAWRVARVLRLRQKTRSGIVPCPHCGYENPLHVLMTCRRCGITEYGSRLYCTNCREVSKSFDCEGCTATIWVR